MTCALLVAVDEVLVQLAVLAEVALRVHRHERRDLQETRVHAPEATGVAHRHAGDEVALEPLERVLHRQLVHRGRGDARVDGAGHRREARRLRGVLALRHHRRGDERGHARLAHRHEVGAGAEHLHPVDDVLHVLVEPEATVLEADVARIVPVGDVDVVLGEQGAYGAAQQRGEVPRQRGHQQHPGLGEAVVLLEVQQRAEGPDVGGLLAHLHRAAAALDALDTEGRSLVGEVRPLHQLADRRQVARDE